VGNDGNEDNERSEGINENVVDKDERGQPNMGGGTYNLLCTVKPPGPTSRCPRSTPIRV